jgi:hypothetical protein
VANPEPDDVTLLSECDPQWVTKGNAQHKFLDAMNALKAKGLTERNKKALADWGDRMPDPEGTLPPRLLDFRN